MIYLDNNATTIPCDAAKEAFLNASIWNPHSVHAAGIEAEQSIQQSKATIAKYLDCETDEIFFTSSATEACNWAIQILREKNCNIIYNEYEHSAVLKPIMAFPQVENPDKNGYVQMLVNNIYGEIYDIPKKEHENDIIFSDATAAIGHIPFSFKKSNIDLLAFGGHKFNAYKGIGCLIIKKHLLPVHSLIWGGDISGGTPAPALVAAMAAALEFNYKNLEEHRLRIQEMQKYIITELSSIPFSYLNGPEIGNKRAINNINYSIEYMLGSDIQKELSDRGIYISTGSACNSDSFVESHGGICVRPIQQSGDREPELITIFKAGGMTESDAKQSIRITLDYTNTLEECKIFCNTLKNIIDFERPM